MTLRRCMLTVVLLLSVVGLQAQGLKVLYMGDSITDGGWGNSGGTAKPSEKRSHTDMNHIYGHSYMFLCATHYQSNYPEEGYQFFNRGVSGYTLADLETRWPKDVLQLNPDVLSVLVGTNDIHKALQEGSEFDVADWARRYRALLDAARQQNPKLELVLCTPFVAATGRVGQSADYAQRKAWVAACADVVRTLAKEYGATLVDFDRMFATLLQRHPMDDGKYWIWDGIHPTPAGHHRMASLWMKRCNRLLR